MQVPKLLILALVFFFTSIISVVTGSTSLITVPVMIQFGIEPHVAVATNMFALIFLSAGGVAPFWKSGMVLRRELPFMAVLTIFGSVVGALLLTKAPIRSLQLVIAFAMIAVAVFSLVKRDMGMVRKDAPSTTTQATIGYGLTVAVAVQQKMMRHADIRTTFNIYGDVVTDEMTTASVKVAQLAFHANGAQTERNDG